MGWVFAAAALTVRAQETEPPPAPAVVPLPMQPVQAPRDDLIDLPEVVISADVMDLEDGVEENRLWSVQAERGSIFADLLQEQMQSREEFGGLDDLVSELGELEPPSLGTGSGAPAPRGFTTPRLRNGFTQQGFPEIITPGKREVISGMLATFFGRTAPGGIVNILTFRPSPRAQHRIELTGSTQPRGQMRVNGTGPVVRRRMDMRVQAEILSRTGPVDFQRETGAVASATLRWRKNPWVIVWDVEAGGRAGVPGNGIPQARAIANAPVIGPYLPLAGFSLSGPHASTRRRSFSTSLTVERKVGDGWLWRSGTQIWTRSMEEHRFRNGQYLLDTGVFAGIREPQWTETLQQAVSQAFELVGITDWGKWQHRWLMGVETSISSRSRGQFLLPTSARNALPQSVRVLDPENPDYTLTPYSRDVYTRSLVDRDEETQYLGAYLSDRVSWGKGRYHATAGMRWDRVATEVNDLRSNAPIPHAERSISKFTGHLGALAEVVRGRLAVFLNASTAFQPNERVDVRTGEIQGNENTAGIETGLRAQTRDRRWAATLGVYRLWNRDITRLNPLFEDPVADPNGAQPQLLSAGEEEFTGAELTARWIASNGLSVTGRVVWTQALTTASPDLPNEVGKQIAGVPEWFGGLTLRQVWELGERRSLGWRLNLNVVGDYVARYASSAREEISYDSFTTVNFSVDYGWGKERRQRVNVLLRNAFDLDLARASGRLDGERRLEASWSMVF